MMNSLFGSSTRSLWRNTMQNGAVMPFVKQIEIFPVTQQVRPFAARKGKRAALLAAKKELKMAQANKPQVPKFLPKKSNKFSGKEVCRITDENWLETSPTDDIWRLKLYRGKPYTFADAVEMLKEEHHSTMLNDPEAFIYVTVELDLQLKKKNHFLEEFTGTILFPHDFESGSSKRLIALCKSSEDQFKSSEAGAAYVGGTTLIKKIVAGEISSEDFDYVICHHDTFQELGVLRGILKKKYPNMRNGLLTHNIAMTVAEFIRCTEYNSNASTLEPDFGWIDVCFGRLSMTNEKLEDNLRKFLNAIEEKHKPTGVQNLFITRTVLWCFKSTEKFKIPHWQYLPGYPINGVVTSEDSVNEDETPTKLAA